MPTPSEIMVLKEAAREKRKHIAEEHKNEYVLPSGAQLMSTPIVKGGRMKGKYEKELDFVMKKIDSKMKIINLDEQFQIYKWILFVVGFTFALAGAVLICFGLHVTIFFEQYQEINYAAIVFGGLFFLPLFLWIWYLCNPNPEEKRRRKKIYLDHLQRKKPTFFNQMTEEAAAHAKPPPRVFHVIAHVRKKDYQIHCTNWSEFCEEVFKFTGLQVERQLIRFKDEDLNIKDLQQPLSNEEFAGGISDGDRLFVYNRGGFFTKDSPIKRQHEEILAKSNALKRPKTPQNEERTFSGKNNHPTSILRKYLLPAMVYIRDGRFLVGRVEPEDVAGAEGEEVLSVSDHHRSLRMRSFGDDEEDDVNSMTSRQSHISHPRERKR